MPANFISVVNLLKNGDISSMFVRGSTMPSLHKVEKIKINRAHYMLKNLFPEKDRAINVDSTVHGYDQENV